MATKAIGTAGTKLLRGDGAGPEVFTVIAEIISFSGPTESAKQIDVTSMDSTAREYIAGLRDSGEISFDCNLVTSSATQQGLREDMDDRVQRNFRLILMDNTVEADRTTVNFTAVVTNFTWKGATD